MRETNVAVEMGNEFNGFHARPSRFYLIQLNLKNKLLRIKDLRPNFNNQEAYEAWLIAHQQKRTLPEHPYGYRVVERLTLMDKVQVSVHHTIQPGIAPPWINNNKLFNNDWDTQRQYMNWAEAYYQKSQLYPPGYLNWIKDLINMKMLVQAGAPLEGGFKDDRRLVDVVLALGGDRHAKEYDASNTKLISLITELNGNDRWLDGGTGSGFVLEDSILTLNTAGLDITDIPHTLGITYAPESSAIDQIGTVHRPSGVSFNKYPSQLSEDLSVKHEIWNKRLFQELPNEEFNPKPKLITDFYGVFSYSGDPAGVINKYLKIMDEGGTIGIVYGDSIVRVGDADVPFHEWLKSVVNDQISVEYGTSWIKNSYSNRADEEGYAENRYVLIRNPSGNFFKIPNLVQVGFGEKDGQWTRIFRPTSSIQNIP
ncbi:MAG: hypothetical protein OXK80_01580 [Bdellovibrionales bacterium]|nr:hypothetical protein [Bdellovibrionales bacterium]